jgi:hypothetical protein
MPYADPESARSYFRGHRRMRRGGDARSTPVHPAVSVEFRLETARDVIGLIESQVQAILDEAEAGTIEKVRCIGYLAGISLKAIECGNLAARLESLETVLKARSQNGKP